MGGDRLEAVRIAGPVCIGSSTTLTARSASRSPRGGSQTSVPVPTISVSMALADLNTRSSEYWSISAGFVTGHAQIPSGRHNSEPRCDMSAKANPPLP